MSLYIKLYADFFSHRKTARLRARLGDDAFWIPPRLWAYAAQNQIDGNFSSYSSDELAMLLECSKHASSLLQALKDCGFMTQEGEIHQWAEHNAFHAVNSNRARKAALARHEKESKEKNKETETETETSTLQASSKDAPSRNASLSPLSQEAEGLRLEWNKLAVVSQCQKITPSRLKSIKARFEEPYFVENWKAALLKIKDSPFCCGDNERGWKASFDWFLKPDSCVRVMEGKYDKVVTKPAQQGGKPNWLRIKELKETIRQLEGQLHSHMDRERNPGKLEQLKAAQAELAKLEPQL